MNRDNKSASWNNKLNVEVEGKEWWNIQLNLDKIWSNLRQSFYV